MRRSLLPLATLCAAACGPAPKHTLDGQPVLASFTQVLQQKVPSRVPTPSSACAGELVYYADKSGLRALSLEGSTVVEGPLFPTPREMGFEQLWVSGERLYATDGDALFAFSLADPKAPALLGSLPIKLTGLLARGTTLYVEFRNTGGAADGVVVVDASDPANMKVVSPVRSVRGPSGTVGGASLLSTETDQYFFASRPDEIVTYSLADPLVPSPVGVVTFGIPSHATAVHQGLAYGVTDFSGLKVADLRDPLYPVLLVDGEKPTDPGATFNGIGRTNVIDRRQPLSRGGSLFLVNNIFSNLKDGITVSFISSEVTLAAYNEDAATVAVSEPLPLKGPFAQIDTVCWNGKHLWLIGARFEVWAPPAAK